MNSSAASDLVTAVRCEIELLSIKLISHGSPPAIISVLLLLFSTRLLIALYEEEKYFSWSL